MTKTLDLARPSGPCGGRCPHAVARPVTDVPDSAKRSDAHLVKMNAVGFLKTRGCYRELVGVEISRASEHGARWWSRRLVRRYEEAGLGVS